MNKLYTLIFRLAFLLSLILSSGCAAINYPQAISAVDPGTTIRGMQAAVNGMPGTLVLENAGNLVMGWPSGSSYSWVAFSPKGAPVDVFKTICGNRACPEVASELYNYLIKQGWKDIPAGAVPPAVAGTIRQFAYLISIGASLPLLPVLFIPLVNPIELINPKTGA